MSVRRVSCPGCSATLNVPATMTNVKCSQCGMLWDINNPPSAKRTPAADSTPSDGQTQKDRANTTMMIGLAGGALALMIFAGVGVMLFASGGKDKPEPVPAAVAEETTEPAETPTFRVVKLPESQRKKIYYDFRQMAASTIEKKIMLPKESVARTTLDRTLGTMADREVQQQALIHGISEDDIMQIVAEGDAKGWPPKRKTKAVKTK